MLLSKLIYKTELAVVVSLSKIGVSWYACMRAVLPFDGPTDVALYVDAWVQQAIREYEPVKGWMMIIWTWGQDLDWNNPLMPLPRKHWIGLLCSLPCSSSGTLAYCEDQYDAPKPQLTVVNAKQFLTVQPPESARHHTTGFHDALYQFIETTAAHCVWSVVTKAELGIRMDRGTQVGRHRGRDHCMLRMNGSAEIGRHSSRVCCGMLLFD